MKPNRNNIETLDDFIFENRNKNYGAYAIRANYNSAMKEAIAFAVTAFAIVIILISQFAFKSTSNPVGIADTEKLIELKIYTIPQVEPPMEEAKATFSKLSHNDNQLFKPVIQPKDLEKKEEQKKKVDPITNELGANGGSHGNNQNGSDSLALGSTNTGKEMGLHHDVSNEIATWVDEMPRFIGGDQAMRNFIITNFKVPNTLEDDNIKVLLTFVIDEFGKVNNIKVKRGSHSLINEEAMRVVASMPDWKPGKTGGKAVKVYYNLPINIKFR